MIKMTENICGFLTAVNHARNNNGNVIAIIETDALDEVTSLVNVYYSLKGTSKYCSDSSTNRTFNNLKSEALNSNIQDNQTDVIIIKDEFKTISTHIKVLETLKEFVCKEPGRIVIIITALNVNCSFFDEQRFETLRARSCRTLFTKKYEDG